MDLIQHILAGFEPITLSEMDNVKLMDRTDTKYTFHVSGLDALLHEAMPYYKILSVENNRISRYKTLYYDTEAFDLYNKHHSGKLNRYKIRHRTYVESELGFLEVKFKNNKGRTIKTRVKEKDYATIQPGKSFDFLKAQLPFCPTTLIPRIWINYSRITLVNKSSAERLTIDLNLEFKTSDATRNMGQLVIAEVKQDSKAPSPFVAILKKKHIREGSISKYCFAVASSFNGVKSNNFKQKLSQVNKLIQTP